MANPLLARRTVLAGAGFTCAGLLAGCGGGDETASGSTPGTAPSAAAGGSAAITPGAAASSAPGPSGQPLVALADVPVGGAVVVDAPSGGVVISQPEAGTVVAYSAKCTHQGTKVVVDGGDLVCPSHGSRFTLEGEATKGPATTPLAKIDVSIIGDQVVSAGA